MATITNARINVRVNKDDKEKAIKLYKSLGLDMSTAINMFIKQSLLTQSIPFNITKNKSQAELDFLKRTETLDVVLNRMENEKPGDFREEDAY